MKDIRIAVIGGGARASLAEVAHQPGRGSCVVAACDPHPGRDARARELFGQTVAILRTTDEVIAHEPDAAFVLSPEGLRAEQVPRLLEAGIPVYVDPPLAATRTDADRILEAGLRSGTLLVVGHALRHAPFLRQMRGLLEQGMIGEVAAVWCRRFVGADGNSAGDSAGAVTEAEAEEQARVDGPLVHRGVQDLDAIHWLTGSRTERVSAFGGLADPDRDGMEISQANLQLSDGTLASYAETTSAPDDWRSYTVIGTSGRMENVGDSAGGVIRVCEGRSSWSPHGDHEFRIGASPDPRAGGDPRGVAEFLRCVATGVVPSVSPIASRDAVAAADAATVSLRGGGAVQQVEPARDVLASYFDLGQEQTEGRG